MNFAIQQAALDVYRAPDRSAAFESAMRALTDLPATGAVWLAGGEVRERWGDAAATLEALEALEDAAPAPERVRMESGQGGALVVLEIGRHGTRDRIGIAVAGPPDPASPGDWVPLREAFLGLVHRREAERAEERKLLRLYTRMEETEALHLLGVTINRTLDLDQVVHVVTRFARTLLGAHTAAMHLRGDGGLERRHTVGDSGGDEEERVVRRVAETGRTVQNPADDGIPDGWIAAPLTQADEVIGALALHYRREFRPTEREARLATAIATQAAVAVANADLHRALEARGRQLEELNRELERQSELKARFFASVNHELRTPLTAILGYQELVLDGVGGPVPERILDFVQRARFATDDLLHLVDELLDMSTLQADRMSLDLEDVGLGDVLRLAHATMEPVAASKSLRFPGPEVPPEVRVRADRGRLRQIVVNLLSNAVKFTDSGVVRIEVEQWPEWAIVKVEDTGPGIAEEDQERIFEEFEQVRGSGKPGGTGLGLAISRRLARLMGGDITVTSPPDGGSTFALRLPMAPGA